MSNFHDSKTFKTYDDYYTPAWVWEKIKHLVPKDTTIWEACMLNATNSKSIETWRSFGYNVVGDTTWDILTCNVPECDMIITNIPFDTHLKKKILARLVEIGKPFIIIMNSLNVFTKYFREIMDLDYTQTIIPSEKFHYCKDGGKEEKKTSFYSVFVCYKMDFSNKQLYL